MKQLFTEHPQSIGESYFQHMSNAFSFGKKMFFASVTCIIHGIFPFLYTSRGSQAIEELHAHMSARNNARPQAPAARK